jgi:hypothetical protein
MAHIFISNDDEHTDSISVDKLLVFGQVKNANYYENP